MINEKIAVEGPVYITPWIEVKGLKGEEVPYYLETLLQWANNLGLAGQTMKSLSFEDGKLRLIMHKPRQPGQF